MCGGVEVSAQKLDCDWMVVFTLWSLPQHSMGTYWKCKFWGPTPALLDQKARGMGPEICVSVSPPGYIDVWLKFENHWTTLCCC